MLVLIDAGRYWVKDFTLITSKMVLVAQTEKPFLNSALGPLLLSLYMVEVTNYVGIPHFMPFLFRQKHPKRNPHSIITSIHCAKLSLFSRLVIICSTAKATKAAAALKKGSGRKATRVHTKVHFFRPRTLKLSRNPKVIAKAHKSIEADKSYDVIKFPLTTESAMKKIEENNTLVFIVNLTANKKQIKDAVAKQYQIKAAKVNTLIR